MFHMCTIDSGMMFYPPSILTNEYGTFLYQPVDVSGTGSFNDDDYFIFRGNQWVLMDTERWQADLARQVRSL